MSERTNDGAREALADHFRRREWGGDAKGYEGFMALHARRGIDPMTCNDGTCRRAVAEADALLASDALHASTSSSQVVTDLAELLLLAMDGDLLPGAGMSVDNAGQDVPLSDARPKEVAHWAARVVARRIADAEQRAYDEGATEVMDVMTPKVAEAWDEGCAKAVQTYHETEECGCAGECFKRQVWPNPYRSEPTA